MLSERMTDRGLCAKHYARDVLGMMRLLRLGVTAAAVLGVAPASFRLTCLLTLTLLETILGDMWTCQKCGEKLENQFESCWRCSAPRPAEAVESVTAPAGEPEKPQWRLTYRMFRGTLATWDDLFTKAAYFATEIGPERVLNISHSADDSDGVVTIWYWTTGEENQL